MRPDNVSVQNARDGSVRRTVQVGVTVVVVALLLKFFVRPSVEQWRAREVQLDAMRTQVQRLASVIAHAPTTAANAAALEAQLADAPTRILRARSRTLAASALQSLVQEIADASNVTVTRLDLTSADRGAGDLPMSLSANGDIYGLTALLEKLRSSRQLLILDKLSVQVNSALRGAPDVLQMTLSLHAPIIVEPTP